MESWYPVSYTHLDVYKRQLYEYAQLRGSHKSLDRYRYAMDSPAAHDIYKKYTDQIDDKDEQMDKACLLYTSRCV